MLNLLPLCEYFLVVHNFTSDHQMRFSDVLHEVWSNLITKSQGSSIWLFPKIGVKPPKSSILIGFSLINHPFWGFSLYFWKHPIFWAFRLEQMLWTPQPPFRIPGVGGWECWIWSDRTWLHGRSSHFIHIFKWTWAVPPPSNSGKWRFIGIPY